MRIKKAVAKFLRWQRVCRVATSGHAAVPHVVPVCHVFTDDKIYFASEGGAKKIEHLRVNPHVAVTVDLYSDDWSILRGVMVQGTAQLIDGGPRFRKLQRLLYEKFPQYPEEAALGEGDVIVEVTPRHVFSWGID
jgi:nitroimidazol reductase NimA-like FMN-containing flavoprotein (pyridoxamine 5'-phosphate oxidase superfamily)